MKNVRAILLSACRTITALGVLVATLAVTHAEADAPSAETSAQKKPQLPALFRPTELPLTKSSGTHSTPGTIDFESTEGFSIGWIDTQVGWTAVGSVTQAQVNNLQPSAGLQHLRIARDPSQAQGTSIGGRGPDWGPSAVDDTTVSLKVSISAPGGADYFLAAFSTSEGGVLTWEVDFNWMGNIFVADDFGAGPVLVDTGVGWVPGSYKTLTICDDLARGTTKVFYDGALIHRQAARLPGTRLEQLLIVSDNWHLSDHGDFDNISIVTGLTDACGCSSDAECDDALPCTLDTCDLATGDCSNVLSFDLCGGVIPAGIDCGSTACGTTRYNFCDHPVPADFFGAGSSPFDGVVTLGGAVGQVDTQIQRLEPILLSAPGEQASTPIELVDLNLISCAPVVVVINGVDTQWDVVVTPSTVPTSPGTMSLSKTHANGGVFTSAFSVQPLFTFTRIDDPSQVIVFDTGVEGVAASTLKTIAEAPWVHTATVTPPAVCGVNFVPGVEEDPATSAQCCGPVGHAGLGHLHVTGPACNPCTRGACCDPSSPTACSVVVEALPQTAEEVCLAAGGQYKGDGTNCDDFDGDGLADWFETSDCCAVGRDVCSTGSDPNNVDTDGDGVLDGAELVAGTDICQPPPPCLASSVPQAELILNAQGAWVTSGKNRFLSMWGGDAGSQQAVRVTLVDLPGAHAALNGTTLWVDVPVAYSELSARGFDTPGAGGGERTFRSSVLRCDPVFRDWSSDGVIHVRDERILPGGTYDVQFIQVDCDVKAEADYSLPLVIVNPQWCDAATLSGGAYLAPDGVVNVFDTLAMTAKFRGEADAPAKVRVDLLGVTTGPSPIVDGKITVSDLVVVLEAFSGSGYPFGPGPAPCGAR